MSTRLQTFAIADGLSVGRRWVKDIVFNDQGCSVTFTSNAAEAARCQWRNIVEALLGVVPNGKLTTVDDDPHIKESTHR
jgi:hypothetical protein